MKQIIIDTNFLLIPGQFKVDIFSEFERVCDFPYKLCVLDKSVAELEKIVKGQKGKDKDAAKLALSLAKAKKVAVLKTKGSLNVDSELVEQGKKVCIVATQDNGLKARLKALGASVITLRQRKYLIMAEG